MDILSYRNYEDAKERFSWDHVWNLFDGDKDNFNMAHECIVRHPGERLAIRIKFSDGHKEQYTFKELST